MYPDLEPHLNTDEVKGYELFIGPNGEYYKVKTIKESDENMTHYEWAKRFFKKNNLESLLPLTTKVGLPNNEIEILVNLLGFVRYTHGNINYEPIFNLPNPIYFDVKINSEQLIKIFDLMKMNKEIRFYNDLLEEANKSKYDYQREQLIEKYTR